MMSENFVNRTTFDALTGNYKHTLADLQYSCHEIAKSKGWWEPQPVAGKEVTQYLADPDADWHETGVQVALLAKTFLWRSDSAYAY